MKNYPNVFYDVLTKISPGNALCHNGHVLWYQHKWGPWLTRTCVVSIFSRQDKKGYFSSRFFSIHDETGSFSSRIFKTRWDRLFLVSIFFQVRHDEHTPDIESTYRNLKKSRLHRDSNTVTFYKNTNSCHRVMLYL